MRDHRRLHVDIVVALAIIAFVIAGCAASSAPAAQVGEVLDANAVHIVAKDIAFVPPTVTAIAGRPFQIAFDNEDGAPHNVEIIAADGTSIYIGATVDGPGSQVYDVPAMSAGAYRFRCDIHPGMEGTLTVR